MNETWALGLVLTSVLGLGLGSAAVMSSGYGHMNGMYGMDGMNDRMMGEECPMEDGECPYHDDNCPYHGEGGCSHEECEETCPMHGGDASSSYAASESEKDPSLSDTRENLTGEGLFGTVRERFF